MEKDRLNSQIEFIKEIDKLKYIQRKQNFSIATEMKMMQNIVGIWQ